MTAEDDKIHVRQAVDADNEALLLLTRLTPMAGRISLRIDRDPNFFALSRARGESTFFVATSKSNVIGCVSVSVYDAYIEGKLERIAHGNDLKVHPDFAGRGLSVQLLLAAENYLRTHGIDLCMSLLADGNQRVVKLAEGNRGQAVSLPLGKFFVDQLLPSPFRKRSRVYTIGKARPEDSPRIAALLDRSSRRKNFAPPVTVRDVEARLEPSARRQFKNTFVARIAEQVVATLTVEDTQHLRQNVPIAAPASVRFALSLLRIAASFVPKIGVPRLGRPLRILYVRFIGCDELHEASLHPLLSEARATAFEHGYTFLSVGLHERDPLRRIVAGKPKLTFTSMAVAANLMMPDRVKTLFDQAVYEDFALV